MNPLALPIVLTAVAAGSALAQQGYPPAPPAPRPQLPALQAPTYQAPAYQSPAVSVPRQQAPVYRTPQLRTAPAPQQQVQQGWTNSSPTRTTRAVGGGRYFGVFGGLNTLDDLDVSGAGLSATAETDDGTVFGAAFGTAIHGGTGMYTRFEIEGSYRSNDLESVDLLGLSGGDGDLTALGVHLNGYLGIPLGRMVTVYGGAGIGVSKLDADVSIGGANFDETISGSFSYQFIAGLEFALSPNVSVYGEYRYYKASSDFGFDALESLGDSVGVDIDSYDYEANSFLIGLRLYF